MYFQDYTFQHGLQKHYYFTETFGLLLYVVRIACIRMLHKTNVAIFTGTGAWESALTNTLSPGDRIVSFLIGQFSLLWIDQQKRLNFNVDVVESDWGQGANLDILASKLAEDAAHTIKAICIVHNETATGVTNDLVKVRQLLGTYIFVIKSKNKLDYSSAFIG